MIKGSDLENRAVTPPAGPCGAEAVTAAIAAMKAKPYSVDELAQLRERIEQAKRAMPVRDAHCGCCYGRGRDEAIATIEGA